MLFAIVMMMAEGPLSSYSKRDRQDDVTDSVSRQQLDTLLTERVEASAKTKRDTSTMDSLELAIYKHNKAVDDSLALDSINRSRKNGIDSPVEYSADDSLHESRQQPGACHRNDGQHHDGADRHTCLQDGER